MIQKVMLARILCLIILATTNRFCRALTNGDDVYENIENCPTERSGPDCSIPYENCKDNKRKCFNNSKCVRDAKVDPITLQPSYSCDCSFASSVSEFAGYECEHSATVRCQGGTHFCTNGGTCGSYIIDHQHFVGCHCPDEFAGKHCQYLKEQLVGFMEGEAAVPEVADNFYAQANVKSVEGSTVLHGAFVAMIVISSISIVVYGVIYFKQNEKLKMLMSSSRIPDSAVEDSIPPPSGTLVMA